MSICTVDRKALLGALSLANSAIAAKPIQPILSHALLSATVDSLTIEATDQKIGARSVIPCRADAPFKASASGSFLSKLASSFDGDTITIEVMPNHWVNVGDGNAQFKIVGLDPKEFPAFPRMVDIAPRFSMPAADLMTAIRSVSKMQTTDGAREYLCCIHFVGNGKTLVVEATDGHRLAQSVINSPTAEFRASVPSSGVDSLMAMLSKSLDGTVDIAISDGALEATYDGATVSCRLLESENGFPLIDEVIPKSYPISIALPSDAVSSAAKRIGLLTTGGGSLGIKIEFVNKGAEFSAVNTDLGSAHQRIEIDGMSDAIKLAIGCNWKYLIDGLDSAPGAVELRAIDEVTPIALVADNWRCVIGVMKLPKVEA